MRPLPSCLRLLTLLPLLLPAAPARATDWIWATGQPGDNQVCFFRKEFRITEAPGKATLTVACDNKATVYLDGKRLGENTEWSAPSQFEVGGLLKPGQHVLAIRAENEGGPAGLLTQLEAVFPSGKKTVTETDASWLVAEQGLAGWNQPDAKPAGFAPAPEPWQGGHATLGQRARGGRPGRSQPPRRPGHPG